MGGSIMTRIDKIRKAIRSQRVECPFCKTGFWVSPESAEFVADAFKRHIAEHARIPAKPADPITSWKFESWRFEP